MHPERKGPQAVQAPGPTRGSKGESSQPLLGKAGHGTPAGSTRGANRPIPRVPTVANRLNASVKGKEAHAAPASLLDPSLKLRKPGKDDISYNRVLNKVCRVACDYLDNMPCDFQKQRLGQEAGLRSAIPSSCLGVSACQVPIVIFRSSRSPVTCGCRRAY